MFNVFECGLIGMGPAGLGLAISLRDTKIIKSMVCFDKGSNVDGAECFALSGKECCGSSACSIISGIGGASTLSGGKISNYPAGSGLASFFDSENQLRELFEKEIAFLSDKIQLKEIQIGSKIRKKTMQFYKQKK